MYDIHCHILPQVDDGAKNIEESIEMAIVARNKGIKTIIATPHYIEYEGYNNYKKNMSILSNLNKELINKDIDITIFLGNEVFITPNILTLLDEGEITTPNNSRYLLIELPTLGIPVFVEELIYRLTVNEIIPIIAHPERNLSIIEDPNELYNLIKMGALAQLNSRSIEGQYGDKAKTTAKLLLKHNMIHFIGTDTHTNKGNNGLASINSLLLKLITKDNLKDLLYRNPQKIILDEKIVVEEPIKWIKKGFLSSIPNEIYRKVFMR